MGVEVHFRPYGGKKRFYVKKDSIEHIALLQKKRFADTACEIIRANLELIDQFIEGYKDYDVDTVNGLLPEAYRIENALYSRKDIKNKETVRQSENPYKRDMLVYPTRSGVFVRSKNEVIICDNLYAAGISFEYEKELELIERVTNTDGRVLERRIKVYPDFTITLFDGSRVYWEHEGLFDDAEYRKENLKKLGLYYDNGIYQPKNLIVTMDGNGKPFDSEMAWRIVNTQILPFV